MSDQVTIGIIISDRTYPLKIDKVDEAMVRRCVKLINEKITEFQSLYAGKDKQDFLAMSALMNLIDTTKANTDLEKGMKDLAEELKKLDELISR